MLKIKVKDMILKNGFCLEQNSDTYNTNSSPSPPQDHHNLPYTLKYCSHMKTCLCATLNDQICNDSIFINVICLCFRTIYVGYHRQILIREFISFQ